jgi:DNA-binding NarL/FixJ family response regulator
MIRVILVEDDEVFRIGLTVSLKQCANIDLVGTASDGQGAITMVNERQPELVLMDIGLPGLSGIEATQIIKTAHPGIKILVLTSHAEPKIVDAMMAAGADGYCMKGISTERLYALIQEVSNGAFWIDAAVAEQIK